MLQHGGIVRNLLISMIMWVISEGFLCHTIPSRLCPVQVSQTIVEILGEGYDGSKKPELTWLPMPENRTKSGLIGVNRAKSGYMNIVCIAQCPRNQSLA
jgi:hypothetical protein